MNQDAMEPPPGCGRHRKCGGDGKRRCRWIGQRRWWRWRRRRKIRQFFVLRPASGGQFYQPSEAGSSRRDGPQDSALAMLCVWLRREGRGRGSAIGTPPCLVMRPSSFRRLLGQVPHHLLVAGWQVLFGRQHGGRWSHCPRDHHKVPLRAVRVLDGARESGDRR